MNFDIQVVNSLPNSHQNVNIFSSMNVVTILEKNSIKIFKGKKSILVGLTKIPRVFYN